MQSDQLRAMGYDDEVAAAVELRQRQRRNFWFEIHPDAKRVENVRKCCHALQYPMLGMCASGSVCECVHEGERGGVFSVRVRFSVHGSVRWGVNGGR